MTFEQWLRSYRVPRAPLGPLYANTIPVGNCLEWSRARSAGGYGVLRQNGRLVYAHRVSLETWLGRKLAPGMLACHTCNNPPCIEPTHLYEGTPSDNLYDRWRAAS